MRSWRKIVFLGSGFAASRRPGMTAERSAGWLTGLALAAATLLKFYPAVIFPALWRRWDWRTPLAFAAIVVLAYLPFIGAGRAVFGFLPGYLTEEGFAGGAGFYLWSLARALLPLDGVSERIYLVAAAGLLAGAGLYALRGRIDAPAGAALLAAAFMVLLSPHYPWYFAWLLVFATLVPATPLLWLTSASFLLYWVPVGSQLVRDRHRLLVESLLYLPFLALAAVDLWQRRHPEERNDGEYRG